MALNGNNNRIRRAACAFVTALLIFSPAFVTPSRAEAEVRVGVQFYIGGVIVIGGTSLYFVFSSGRHRHSDLHDVPINPSLARMSAQYDEFETSHDGNDLPFRNGMVEIMKW